MCAAGAGSPTAPADGTTGAGGGTFATAACTCDRCWGVEWLSGAVKTPTSARTTLPKPGIESGAGDVSAIAPSTAYTATTAAPSPPAATMPRDRLTIQDPAGSLLAKLI